MKLTFCFNVLTFRHKSEVQENGVKQNTKQKHITGGNYKMNKRQIREYQKLKRQMENIKLFFGLSAMFVLIPGIMLAHWIVSVY